MQEEIIKSKFKEIGAEVVFADNFHLRGDGIRVDVRNDKFLIEKNPKSEWANLNILDVQKDERHLLLLVKIPRANTFGMKMFDNKERILCGHDERHWFSAGIRDNVSTVKAAKESLLPDEFKSIHKKKGRKKNLTKRSNETGKRQGEWLFIKSDFHPPEDAYIRKNEPISRGRGSKPHICQELYNRGGQQVHVNNPWASNGVSYERMLEILKDHPRAHFESRTANATVYVRGTVKHADHKTIKLIGWHKVIMNRENLTGSSVFLD